MLKICKESDQDRRSVFNQQSFLGRIAWLILSDEQYPGSRSIIDIETESVLYDVASSKWKPFFCLWTMESKIDIIVIIDSIKASIWKTANLG